MFHICLLDSELSFLVLSDVWTYVFFDFINYGIVALLILPHDLITFVMSMYICNRLFEYKCFIATLFKLIMF